MNRVAFVGLGTMGLPMARNVLRAGYDLSVYDIVPDPVEELAHEGAHGAESARDAADGCDALITMVPESAHVEAAVLGKKGGYAGLSAGAVHIEMSTIEPSATRRIASQAQKRRIRFLDAPVGKSSLAAAEGELTIMVGGDPELLAECRPLLETMGSTIHHCGEIGAGEIVKACNNLVSGGILALVAEAIVVGTKAGVDPDILVDVMAGTAASNWHLENTFREKVFRRSFEPGFKTALMLKDARLGTGLAAEQGVPVPISTLVREAYANAVAHGLGDEDWGACTKPLEEAAGVEVRGRGAGPEPKPPRGSRVGKRNQTARRATKVAPPAPRMGTALTEVVEEEILAGERGRAAQLAFESQLGVAEFFGARQFVAISNAHVSVDWEVMGDAGMNYLERLVSFGGQVAVPTTRNSGPVDASYAQRLRQDKRLVEGERRVAALLRKLGVTLVDTCINYQSVYQPHLAEHVAWGDTGAATYANAVLGARTNFESGPAALAAALTGRTPAYGFHLEECRVPKVRCEVAAPLEDTADWGALGAVVGTRLQDYWTVPILDGVEDPPMSDALKHLAASIASYGSVAMFHMPGVTPEAEDLYAERAIERQLTITSRDLHGVYAQTGAEGDPVNLVVFTAPQLSLVELRELALRLEGRRVKDGVTLLVTTNAMVHSAAEAEGYVATIEEAGGHVLRGTCWYLMAAGAMREEFGWGRVVTSSAKLVNIIKAYGYEPVLRRTEACIEAAVTGKVPAV